MSLSSDSNTINALGIFGRLDKVQEDFFQELSAKYSRYPTEGQEAKDATGVFNHLTLVGGFDVTAGEIPAYLDLLRNLKPHLPFKLKVSGVIVKEDKHLALEFDKSQTEEIRKLATKYLPEGVVATHYTKVVWFVPKENQEEAMAELSKVTEMTFGDFILVANRQDDEHTIYSSNRFK